MTWRTLVCVLLFTVAAAAQQQRIGSITQNGACNIAGITGSNVTVNCVPVPAKARERIEEDLAESVKQKKITPDQAREQLNELVQKVAEVTERVKGSSQTDE